MMKYKDKVKNILMKMMDEVPLWYGFLLMALIIYGIAGLIYTSANQANARPFQYESAEKVLSCQTAECRCADVELPE